MQPFFAQFSMDIRQLISEDPNLFNSGFSDFFQSFDSDISFQFTNQSRPFINIDNLGIQMTSIIRNEGRNDQKNQIQEMLKKKSESYTRLSKYEIQNNKLNKNEPHIKITVTKKQNQLNPSQQIEHYINSFGMIDSIKNADSEDVIIGRQEKLENSQGQLIFPNDIILREAERLISRIHCKIIFQNFFRKETLIQPIYKQTLDQLKLHQNIIQRISSFLEEPKDCYVQDLGSVFGTHIKVDRSYSQIQKYQQYCLGSETTIQILEIHNLGSEQKQSDIEFDKLISKLRNIKYRCSLQGLNLKLYERALQTEQSFEQILINLKSYNIPFIMMKFGGSGVTDDNQNIFFAKNISTVFSIGRGNDNNIRINSNTISRKQTRFRFNKKENCWEIADGTSDKESANGTWMQLQTIQERDQKHESQVHPLKHLSEIKISEYILKIELFKGKEKENTRFDYMKSFL
ncbi:unnamed protein product [Paramecium sonneborni]|uniref:FHA domain-containing protein n=1 Tax=Paramecium sonneborni TaxID=65129 RepID=A0A8S1MF22_9CILI|nr:unnamed protein product [Paramecium sonneborni]